jgi:N-acetyl-gamma-glutamyl-phosphate reductase
MSEAGIRTIVIGAGGYVGGELLRLIALHPQLKLAGAVSASQAGKPIGGAFPHLQLQYAGQDFCDPDAWAGRVDAGDRLAIFSAAPHGTSAAQVAASLAIADNIGAVAHVVDASADFRFGDTQAFESVYGIEHAAPQLVDRFSCAVPEHLSSTATSHIGHPGCFATAILLAAVPLFTNRLVDGKLFVSATTGSTGSGRQPQPGTHHPERHSNLYAYKPLVHRHVPEVQKLIAAATGGSADIRFIPHSGPFARGIYATLQADSVTPLHRDALLEAFRDYYEGATFVRIQDGMPKLKNVVASNFADIGADVIDGSLVVSCAIDNLVKGAAGGAVQWMNRLMDLPETTGLLAPAPAWT